MDKHTLGLRDFVIEKKIQHVLCSFSGGKDSLVATHVAHKMLKDLNIPIEVIHVDTTISLPGVQDYVKSVCEKFGWKLVIVRPEIDFLTLAAKWGMPTITHRWCVRWLKITPLLNYAMSLHKSRVLFVTGLRRFESARRRAKMKKEYFERKVGAYTIYNYDPILYWDDAMVKRYIKEHDLPINPIYQLLGFSGECMCGVFNRPEDWVAVAKHFPEFIERFRILEESYKKNPRFSANNYKVFWYGGKPLSVDELLEIAKREKVRITLDAFSKRRGSCSFLISCD